MYKPKSNLLSLFLLIEHTDFFQFVKRHLQISLFLRVEKNTSQTTRTALLLSKRRKYLKRVVKHILVQHQLKADVFYSLLRLKR